MNKKMKNIATIVKKYGNFTKFTRHYLISIVDYQNGDYMISTMLRDNMGMSDYVKKFVYRNGVLLQDNAKYPVKWDWSPDMFVGGLERNWAEIYYEDEAKEVKEYLHSLIK